MSAMTVQQTIKHLQMSRKEIEKQIQHERDMLVTWKRSWADFSRYAVIHTTIIMLFNFAWFVFGSYCYIHDIGDRDNWAQVVFPYFGMSAFGFFLYYTVKDWREAKDDLYIAFLKW